MSSLAERRALALVAERRAPALTLGRQAADRAQDPSSVAAHLRTGLTSLADADYLDGQRRVAPGIGPILGVRRPLLTAVTAGLRAGTRRDSTATLLGIAERLMREELLELHWLAYPLLERAIVRNPEQAWQLIRAEARGAGDWITVDSLAHVVGRGILGEPFRWVEPEQLEYSPSRWERRLAGSTVATIPFVDRRAGRTPEVARHGLGIVESLIGDNEPDVQKALSWALRSMTLVDEPATAALLRVEATIAARTGDGLRAWVIRDVLQRLPSQTRAELGTVLVGIRWRPGAAATSRAAATAAAFTWRGVPGERPGRPVVPRS